MERSERAETRVTNEEIHNAFNINTLYLILMVYIILNI